MVIISQYIQISNVMWHRCVCSAAPDALQPHGLQLTRVLCPWDFSGKNTGVGCHFLLQGMSLTQCTNPHLLCLLHEQVVFFLSFFFFLPQVTGELRGIRSTSKRGKLNFYVNRSYHISARNTNLFTCLIPMCYP